MQRLSVQSFVNLAESETNLNDWGTGDFRENLALVTEDVYASNPHENGILAYQHRVSRILKNRLKLVEDRKNDPLIARQKINAPLFVTGLPRTGTTFLHSLLAQDPESRSPAEWEATRPSPPPRTAAYYSDERIALSQSEAPKGSEFLKRHIQDAQLPIECGPAALSYEFLSGGFDIRWRTPRYRERLKANFSTAYEWHRLTLQHLQSHTTQSHWVLKSPEHIGHLQELFAVYPDARIVFTHREPEKVFPSLASLTAFMQEENLGPLNHLETGPEVLAIWKHMLDAFQMYRDHNDSDVTICDVTHRELAANPMEIIERVYAHFNMPLSTIAEIKMTEWLKSYGQGRYRETHGTHLYTAQEYGLDEKHLRKLFQDYTERYLTS